MALILFFHYPPYFLKRWKLEAKCIILPLTRGLQYKTNHFLRKSDHRHKDLAGLVYLFLMGALPGIVKEGATCPDGLGPGTCTPQPTLGAKIYVKSAGQDTTSVPSLWMV